MVSSNQAALKFMQHLSGCNADNICSKETYFKSRANQSAEEAAQNANMIVGQAINLGVPPDKVERWLMEERRVYDSDPNSYFPRGHLPRPASEFGEDNTTFLWNPFFPVGDYTVVMAAGGTGKTLFLAKVAADVSTGTPLPGDEWADGEPRNVLFISGEDSGEILKKRLQRSGADLNRVFILDRSASVGVSFAEGFDEFADIVKDCRPSLVIVDPWHGFLGANVNMDKANAVRPIFQKIANLAKQTDCAIALVSHVNKRAQGENANNAATGSSDFINAARSALQVIFDEQDRDCRIVIHTKSNYMGYGQSVRFRITDGGVEWAGFSPITRQTLELAARRRSTPFEVMQLVNEEEATSAGLIHALKNSVGNDRTARFSYEAFRATNGDYIFGDAQPKRALDSVKSRLKEDGFYLTTGIQVKDGAKTARGFSIIRRTDDVEQTELG